MKLIDLFAGCGGLTQGFTNTGFEPVYAVEWDLAAASTYAANFGADHIFCGDIAELDDSTLPKADVVIGGPPCQGFSNLGTKDPDDPRNRLWRDYMRVVTAVRPKIFVIENVARFEKSHEFGLLKDEVESGALVDYHIQHAVLNAADFGAPQRRRRAIVIGSRVGDPILPQPTHAKTPRDIEVSGGPALKQWTTVREAFTGIPWEVTMDRLPDRTVEYFEDQEVPGPFSEAELHLRRNPRPLSLERYDHVPPGGGRFDLPDRLLPNCWRNKPTGTTDVMGRMRWDAPSLTIRTEFFKPEKGQYLHPQWNPDDPNDRVNRPITHREAARLQGFPDTFEWCGTKIEIAKQIGNAVPVPLASAIAESVRDQLR